MKIKVLIPAYHPDNKLTELCRQLLDIYEVVVIDDGSGEQYKEVFSDVEKLGIPVIHHEVNKGKGAALKTGIKYISDMGDVDGIITADADGQHTLEDIKKVAKKMEEYPDRLILGVRDISQMPLRSKFGNSVSCFFFKMSTGLAVSDTQTGLRGIPACLYSNMLSIEGDRYEYEMNMLLELKNWNADFAETTISTLYLDGYKSSHFHPVRDGLKVFSRIIKYAGSSVICAVVDYALYFLLYALSLPVWACYAGARVVSAVLNYILNCKVVFKDNISWKSFFGYAVLCLFSMAVGSFGANFLAQFIGAFAGKLVCDVILFIFNYYVQKKIIFTGKRKAVKNI